MVLQDAADMLKLWWKKGDVKVWMTDKESIPIIVTEDLPNYEYGIFPLNNAIDEQKMNIMSQLAEKALASGGAEYLDTIIEMLDAENSSEAKSILKKGMGEMRKQAQSIQQQGLQIEQMKAQAMQKANQLKEMELQIKGTVPIQVAQIQTQSKEKIADKNIEFQENESEIEHNQTSEQIMLKGMVDSNKTSK